MLKIRSLTKKFKEKTVLMDVNLDIHSGSVFWSDRSQWFR